MSFVATKLTDSPNSSNLHLIIMTLTNLVFCLLTLPYSKVVYHLTVILVLKC